MKKLDLHSEKDLVVKFKSGDQFAFEILFYKYKNKLNGFVTKMAPSNIDPDDVVQNVFIKIWTQREKIDEEKSFSAFLYIIARNEMIEQLRSSISKRIYFCGDGFMNDFDFSDATINDDQIELEHRVTGLINILPERRRQIFELNRYDGLTYKQIAQKLGISENTVDTQIRKSLAYLRAEIKKISLSLIFFLQKR